MDFAPSTEAVADFMVVGGGSAGCVVASRLSERTDTRVVLLESGAVFDPEDEPKPIRDVAYRAFFNPSYMWPGLTAEAVASETNHVARALPYLHARVLGGGSSVNGMLANRGLPADYDEWESLGAKGWGWADVLPFFRKLETDHDFSNDLHGTNGPIQLTRYKNLSGFEEHVWNLLRERGIPDLADLNSVQAVGAGRNPMNLLNGVRSSVAQAYLGAQVRRRANLQVLGDTTVNRLLIENGCVTGVIVAVGDRTRVLRARHVVLSAGAISSPLILLRSGIGAASDLRALGIEPVCDLPGVGANLQNHPSMMLAGYLPRSMRRQERRPPSIFGARYSSDIAGCHEADMMLTVVGAMPGPTRFYPVGKRFGGLVSVLQKPYSRGVVQLSASGAPAIKFNMLHDERDMKRMIQGWQTICGLFASLEEKRVAEAPFTPMTMGPTSDDLGSAAFSALAALALDGAMLQRSRLIESIGMLSNAVAVDSEGVRQWVRAATGATAHASGTCRMGSPDDRNAVVDPSCQVIGMRGLSVIDASIFPTLMRGATNLSVIMVGERAAAILAHQVRTADTSSNSDHL